MILDLYFIFSKNLFYLINGQCSVGSAIQLVFYSAIVKYLQNMIIDIVQY